MIHGHALHAVGQVSTTPALEHFLQGFFGTQVLHLFHLLTPEILTWKRISESTISQTATSTPQVTGQWVEIAPEIAPPSEQRSGLSST